MVNASSGAVSFAKPSDAVDGMMETGDSDSDGDGSVPPGIPIVEFLITTVAFCVCMALGLIIRNGEMRVAIVDGVESSYGVSDVRVMGSAFASESAGGSDDSPAVKVVFKSKSGRVVHGAASFSQQWGHYKDVTLRVPAASGGYVEYARNTLDGGSHDRPKTNGATAYRNGNLKSGAVDIRK